MRYTIFLSVASIVVGVYGRESLQPLRNVYRYHAYCAAYCLMVCTSILAHNFPSPIFFPFGRWCYALATKPQCHRLYHPGRRLGKRHEHDGKDGEAWRTCERWLHFLKWYKKI